MLSHRCLTLLLASAVLYSAPVLAADTCNYPAGYICYDKLVFRPNGMGPWGAFSKGDGKAPNGFAAKSCAEGNFEGKSGWRLPTEKELLAFVSSDARPRSEGNGWVLNGGATWTSTPATRPGYFRYVSFRLDMVDKGQFPDYDARYVTCVREEDRAGADNK